MACNFQTIFLFIGVLAAFAKCSGIKSTRTTLSSDEKKDKVGQEKTCSGFPTGLIYEPDLVIGWTRRWENQCPQGSLSTSLWSPFVNATIQDMKCCEGPVDQVLSEMLFGLERKTGGPSGVNQTWNVQCSGNYVVTGIKIVGNVNTVARVAGIKCSVIVDKQIDYTTCTRLEFNENSGKTRDQSLAWNQECHKNQGLVGLYSKNGFSSIEYGRCCSMTDIKALNVLPISCAFKPNNMCGWTLSRNSTLKWEFVPAGKDDYMLWLVQGKPSGSASLTSPGFSFSKGKVCFRLTYQLIWLAALSIYTKSYNKNDGVSVIKEVITLTQNKDSFKEKDVLMDVPSSFQVVIEAKRLKRQWSNVMIKSVGFVDSSQCQVDQCTPTSGCGIHESCIPSGPNGFARCICKNGYERQNGQCKIKPPSTSTLVTSLPVKTASKAGGKDRGGDGNVDVVTPKSKSKLLPANNSGFQPWMYTVIGAICGTLLVVFLIMSFMTYRRRRLTRRTYQFNFDVNYLRARSLSDSYMSDNNNSYVMEPTSPIPETEIQGPVRDDFHAIPKITIPDDDTSIKTGTPPSHHYFEVEPEVDLERKTSQITLVSPVYGSSEDVSEQFGAKEVFLEPPSDERELCAQLDREIDWRQLTILHEKQLGQGAFGYVHFGIWNTSDGDRKGVAIKTMKDSNSPEERIKFLQEAAIMKQFAHQNVVFMFGVVTKRYPPMIVLEYMKNGNLRKFLRRERKQRLNGRMNLIDRDLQKTFLKMAREIAAGMKYLSGMQFVHRDLAARNILLDDNMVCKIGDFGLARDLIGCNHYISKGGQIPVKWTSPEALSFRRYSSASDVWSFGVLLFEIWSVGKKPYEEWSNDEVIEKVCNKGFRLPPPKDCPRVIYHLMIDCWHPEETKRPKFSQIKFCLVQRDDRLLGRQNEGRQRSATLNEIACETIKEDQYGELQYTYCKTD